MKLNSILKGKNILFSGFQENNIYIELFRTLGIKNKLPFLKKVEKTYIISSICLDLEKINKVTNNEIEILTSSLLPPGINIIIIPALDYPDIELLKLRISYLNLEVEDLKIIWYTDFPSKRKDNFDMLEKFLLEKTMRDVSFLVFPKIKGIGESDLEEFNELNQKFQNIELGEIIFYKSETFIEDISSYSLPFMNYCKKMLKRTELYIKNLDKFSEDFCNYYYIFEDFFDITSLGLRKINNSKEMTNIVLKHLKLAFFKNEIIINSTESWKLKEIIEVIMKESYLPDLTEDEFSKLYEEIWKRFCAQLFLIEWHQMSLIDIKIELNKNLKKLDKVIIEITKKNLEVEVKKWKEILLK